MTEVWEESIYRPYEVSNLGRFRRGKRILKPRILSGSVRVQLTIDGRQTERALGKLVAEAFVPLPSADCERVEHIDGDPWNNRAENLRWVEKWEEEEDG